MIDSKKYQRVSIVISVILTVLFIFSGLGLLTEIGKTFEEENPLGVYERSIEKAIEPKETIDTPNDEDAVPEITTEETTNEANPIIPVTIPDNPAVKERLSISFSSIPNIKDAKAGQKFNTKVKVRNNSVSTDSSYIKVKLALPSISGDLPIMYNAVSGWDIYKTNKGDKTYITAYYKRPVRSGQSVTLFNGVSISKNLNKEWLQNLMSNSMNKGKDAPSFLINMKATGVQASAFDGYKSAFGLQRAIDAYKSL